MIKVRNRVRRNEDKRNPASPIFIFLLLNLRSVRRITKEVIKRRITFTRSNN